VLTFCSVYLICNSGFWSSAMAYIEVVPVFSIHSTAPYSTPPTHIPIVRPMRSLSPSIPFTLKMAITVYGGMDQPQCMMQLNTKSWSHSTLWLLCVLHYQNAPVQFTLCRIDRCSRSVNQVHISTAVAPYCAFTCWASHFSAESVFYYVQNGTEENEWRTIDN
jgi:hypothetical protein